jgi:hypothetical protein
VSRLQGIGVSEKVTIIAQRSVLFGFEQPIGSGKAVPVCSQEIGELSEADRRPRQQANPSGSLIDSNQSRDDQEAVNQDAEDHDKQE